MSVARSAVDLDWRSRRKNDPFGCIPPLQHPEGCFKAGTTREALT